MTFINKVGSEDGRLSAALPVSFLDMYPLTWEGSGLVIRGARGIFVFVTYYVVIPFISRAGVLLVRSTYESVFSDPF